MKWTSFISGAVIGGGLALLLAPQGGAELRAILCTSASRTKDDLLERAEEAFDKGEEIIHETAHAPQAFDTHTQDFVREPGRSALQCAWNRSFIVAPFGIMFVQCLT